MPLANTATLSGTQARGLELLPSQSVPLRSDSMGAPSVGRLGEGDQSNGTLPHVHLKI